MEVLRIGAIGDVLMCTPTLRELKRRHPDRQLRFYTNFPSLVRGLPYIDEVKPAGAAPLGTVPLEYEPAVPSSKHLAEVIASQVGVALSDVRPDCVVDRALVARFRAAWRKLPRPHIIVSRSCSEWTPNKDWPERNWTRLIGRLARIASVMETGTSGADGTEFGSGYIDLRGRTSLDELVAAIAAADFYIGPVSAPLHIAAAVGTPAVVIVSGYEHPSNTRYDGNVVLYTPVACSPCWLRTRCPNGLQCLNAILPEQVEAAALCLWAEAGGAAKAAQ
jgi:ADP-heptose:LPS heptosyltransferase